MFQKILIANRGEIACRIIKTAKKMGIKTVAVYSEIDQESRHVQMADEAFLIGPASAQSSYLDGDKIIQTALNCKAQAIHPGYGFLSENATFAQAVKKAGLIFIAPHVDAIRVMGDKITAKELAENAGVPLVPGTKHALTDLKEVEEFASIHGYPLLLKAAAGGGGKGMRIVYNPDETQEAFTRAVSEAKASFGDGRVFIEKYIENPHHVEIQVLGDQHGNVIHLWERDCSLQRRHQKVIEETPSPFIHTLTRQKMVEAALSLAKAVKYDSAGTVEFIVAADQSFYFLEMNTRLQVEHPVTEAVTGLDLVEEMIHVAAGTPLRHTQTDIHLKGHAIEVRLYAEDPENDFLPSSGRLVNFKPAQDCRLDTGVVEGDVISIYYDPMIAKLTVHAPDRPTALRKMSDCLGQTVVDGLGHNLAFLQELTENPDVVAGNYHTHTIQKIMANPRTFDDLPASQRRTFLIAASQIAMQVGHLQPQPYDHIKLMIDGQTYDLKTPDIDLGTIEWLHARQVFKVTVEEGAFIGQVRFAPSSLLITLFGRQYQVIAARPRVWELMQHIPLKKNEADIKTLRAPMPGLVISLPISVGQTVRKGQVLAVIEAMKMENALRAPAEAMVTDILVKDGEIVCMDQVIARFG